MAPPHHELQCNRRHVAPQVSLDVTWEDMSELHSENLCGNAHVRTRVQGERDDPFVCVPLRDLTCDDHVGLRARMAVPQSCATL